MLLAAQELGCVRSAALIAALSQSRNILLRSEGKRMDEIREDILGGEGESDFFTLMRAWRFAQGRQFDMQRCRPLGIHAGSAREVAGTLDQLLRLSERAGLDVEEKAASAEAIQRCILFGFSDQLARRIDQGTLRCRLIHHRTGELVRDSIVRKSPLFVAGEIREVESRDELRVLLSQATAVEEPWLRDAFPRRFRRGHADSFRFQPAPRRHAQDAPLPRPRARLHRAGWRRPGGSRQAPRGGSPLRPLPAQELGRRRRAMVRPPRLPAPMDVRARPPRRR